MMSPDFGAQAFLWWRSEVADRDLTLMSNGGFRWVKQWFAWNDIEGAGKGQYDWSIPDRIVQQAELKRKQNERLIHERVHLECL